MADAPRVFLSYSHDSAEHADRVLALADALRDRGIDVILDRFVRPAPAEGWPLWMERNLKAADFVLLVCTKMYYRRVRAEETPGQGTGVRWEGRIVYNHLCYGANPGGTRFIPILLSGAEPTHIPDPVRGHNHYQITAFDLSDPGFEALYRHLTDQPATLKPDLGEVVILPPKSRPQPSPGPLSPSGGPVTHKVNVGGNIIGSAIGTGNTVNARDINVSLNQGAMSLAVGRIADEFRDVLRPLMGDREKRQARLDWAFAGHHGLIDQISVDGDTSTFLSLLFKKLREYGEIEVGKLAVCVLLESIKGEVGLRDRERIEEILRVYPR
jgi:hypothetical protein